MATAIVGVLAAASQLPAQQQTFSGTVVLPDGQPAADVEVTLEPYAGATEPPITARTDAEGKFTLNYAPQGLFGRTIVARNAAGDLMGYKFFMFQRTGNETPPRAVELQLAPPASVAVKVSDGSGAGVAAVPVSGLCDYSHVVTAQTDAAGAATLTIPPEARLRTIFAKQGGVGFDYANLFDEQRFFQGERFTVELPTEPVQLTLDGARNVTVTLTDTDGQPLSGTRIFPWLFNKTARQQGTQFNAAMSSNLFQTTTDASGVATFDWFPTWEKSQEFVFWPMVNSQNEHRIQFNAMSADNNVTYQIERGVRISGIAKKPDGAPAPGVMISVRGVSQDNNQFGNSTQTGPDGRYQLEVTGGSLCMLLVDDQNWAAAMKMNVDVQPKTDITDLDFDLREPTKITGRITLASSGRAVPRQSVSLQQSGMDISSRQQRTNQYMAPLNHYRQTMTDDDGRFEFKVGPGQFLLRGSQNSGPQQFTVNDDKSLEFNFSIDRADRGPFTAQIVPGKTGADVAGALLELRSENQWWSPSQTEANSAGKAETERNQVRAFVLARTRDGKFAEVTEVGPDASTVTIEVKECGTITGRLINALSGKPLKNSQFNYGVVPDLGMTIYGGISFAGGSSTTDDDGRFTMDNVIVGQKYTIEVQLQDQPLQTRTPLSVTSAGAMDVGDVRAESQAVVASAAAIPAAVPGTVPEPAKISWSKMLVIGNLIAIPLIAIGFFFWSRRAG
ncbi:MAG: hypothetical protein JNG89_07395 [Planctomycetaceae bacterium]|nr:hypothetical protein [Planctomycetaceae bacterium]